MLLCTGLYACSSDTASFASNGSSEANDSLQVDENLLTVEYTIPASFYKDSDQTAEEAVQEMIDSGNYIDVVINDDGSITAKQTKAKHEAALLEYKQDVDETINSYLNGENKVESFVNIEYSDDMDEFNVYVDPTNYSEWDGIYALAFEMSGYFYQLMNAVPEDQMDVIVNFINNDTGEIMDSASLRDMLESE